MLVLTRGMGEKIQIGDQVTLTVLEVCGQRVKIAIEAPGQLRVVRGELTADLEARVASPGQESGGRGKRTGSEPRERRCLVRA